jgi:oligopeptide/dipeptide ABC transporter ATP-binding protein
VESVIRVENLRTYFDLDEGVLKAVDNVSFSVSRQGTLGIIGESGCGKSVTAQSILQIVPPPGRIAGGDMWFQPTKHDRVNLADLSPRSERMRRIRGRHISMIFQEPMTSLSPVHSVGSQITEALLLHKTEDKQQARDIAMDMLDAVGISNPTQRFHEYPHQLSGGMRQRIMIAMALSCNPTLVIADEPTTALDVTVQAQILELMKGLQEQFGMSMLYITHDLGVIAKIADQVAVMYLGKIVERASRHDLFHNPLHPYTRRLLKSIPRMGRKARVRLDAIEGTVPIPINPPWACGFEDRCPERMAGRCDTAVPDLVEVAAGHEVRCFLHSDAEEPPAQGDGGVRGRRGRTGSGTRGTEVGHE